MLIMTVVLQCFCFKDSLSWFSEVMLRCPAGAGLASGLGGRIPLLDKFTFLKGDAECTSAYNSSNFPVAAFNPLVHLRPLHL
jgi:hypothetical protein